MDLSVISGLMAAIVKMKRILDITVALGLLLLASPLMLVTIAGVLVFLGPPIFFTQARPFVSHDQISHDDP